MTYNIVFDAMGDQTRRRIFDRLRMGPCSVTALASDLPISRPAVSQHLKILKEAGLVTDEAKGARRLYRAAPGGVMAMRTWLDGFWNQVFADFEAEMRRQMDERKST